MCRRSGISPVRLRNVTLTLTGYNFSGISPVHLRNVTLTLTGCNFSGISPVHLRNVTLTLTGYNFSVNVQFPRTISITVLCSPTSSRPIVTLIIILILESTKARIMELLRNLIRVLTLMRLYV
jgi:hypothetical protein